MASEDVAGVASQPLQVLPSVGKYFTPSTPSTEQLT